MGLTSGKVKLADPGPYIKTIVIRRGRIVNSKFRGGTNLPRTRERTVTSKITGNGTPLFTSSALCIALRPYDASKGAPPYASTVLGCHFGQIICNSRSPGPGRHNTTTSVLRRTNVGIAHKILRGRYSHLVEKFEIGVLRKHP